MSFLSLPTEICINILVQLAYNDLLRLKTVSKAFLVLISSPAVQYRIQLGIAALEDDDPKGAIPISDKIRLLEQIETMFRLWEFPQITSIAMSTRSGVYGIQDGVFVPGRLESIGGSFQTKGADVYRLRAPMNPGDMGASWRLPDFESPIMALVSCPQENLLITMEEGEHSLRDDCFILRFLSLSDGRPHPNSHGPVTLPSSIPLESGEPQYITMRSIGEIVGLRTIDSKVYLVNWVTGQSGCIVPNPSSTGASPIVDDDIIDDVLFLDETHCFLIRGRRNPAELEVYEFDRSAKLTLKAVYQLPRRKGRIEFSSTNGFSRARFRGANALDGCLVPPFAPVPEECIFLIKMMIMGPEGDAMYPLLFRGESLLRLPSGVTKRDDGISVVSGHLWMRETHIMEGFSWDHPSYGTRVLLPNYILRSNVDDIRWDDERLWNFTIIDCNPAQIAQIRASASTPPLSLQSASFDRDHVNTNTNIKSTEKVSCILEPMSIGPDTCLDEEWICGLPVAVISFKTAPVRGECVIDGERFVIIERAHPWSERDASLHVHTYA